MCAEVVTDEDKLSLWVLVLKNVLDVHHYTFETVCGERVNQKGRAQNTKVRAHRQNEGKVLSRSTGNLNQSTLTSQASTSLRLG